MKWTLCYSYDCNARIDQPEAVSRLKICVVWVRIPLWAPSYNKLTFG